MAYIDGKLASGERVAPARTPALVRTRRRRALRDPGDRRRDPAADPRARSPGRAGRSTLLGWVVLALVLGGLVYLGWQILRWVNEEFVVTTRRVLQLEGVLNKRVIDSSLEKINDAVLTQSIFGRIFGFGDLDILTASETGISRLRMLKDADDFKRAMLEAKHELELELSGARPLPSPPLRASSGPPSGRRARADAASAARREAPPTPR